jgi:hypothetical protein
MSVTFLVESNEENGENLRRVRAGAAMIGISHERVVSATLDIVTSKTSGCGKSLKIEPAVISRNSEASCQLLKDLVLFVQHSGADGNDPLLSFYRTSTVTGISLQKTITRKEINGAIKDCAVRCGLPPRFFSATSLRKGHATYSALSGVPAELRNKIGGWAPNSKVPDKHYNQSGRVIGALDLATRAGTRALNVRQLRAIIPDDLQGGRPLGFASGGKAASSTEPTIA